MACALGSVWLPALANPAGGQVVSGAVTINSAPGVTTINQASRYGIINWQSFSIQPGERTQFIQPSANSATLNRVVGGNPSAIHGSLQANGQVFLINPNGVLVGPGGSVQTGSFVASTRDVSNAQFLQGGALDFLGSSMTSVVNLGSIHASSGDVHLIAYQVDNKGSVTAPNGTVGLASGTQVLLSQGSSERLLVKPQGIAEGSSVSNSGRIAAANVELKAAGGNPFALAINAGGSISAVSLEQSGGRILLKAMQGKTEVSGNLTATQGSKGGEIQALGDQVVLTSTANLQASGGAGGGTLLVGGDYQGKNAGIQNAKNVLIETGARLSADATVQGDGGKIIVWADEATTYRGTGSARGGTTGGNGGFAEVSGKQALAYTGTVDLRAPQGEAGTLLLDPTDITINNSAATGSLAVAGNTSVLTRSDIGTALGLGNVVISTTSAGAGSGDITFDQLASAGNTAIGYFYNAANRLTLQAERDIIVNERVQVTNGAGLGEMVFQAGRNLTINNHGFGADSFSQVFLNSPKLTLIADNNNLGNSTTARMSFANNVRLFSDNLRLFVPSTSQLDRPSTVTLTNSTPNIGKWVGDAGTSAEGIYARRAAIPSAITPIAIPIRFPAPIIIESITFNPSAPSIDVLVAATGDETLINALKVLNAAKEQLATDPNNATAREVARAAEKAIRDRLPDFDEFQQRRRTDAEQLNDPQVNQWLKDIDSLEASIIKFGRDPKTLALINQLKSQIDAALTAREGTKLLSEIFTTQGLTADETKNLLGRLYGGILANLELSSLTSSGADKLSSALDQLSSEVVRIAAITPSTRLADINKVRSDALEELRLLELKFKKEETETTILSFAFGSDNWDAKSKERAQANELRDRINKMNLMEAELQAQSDRKMSVAKAFVERVSQLQSKIVLGRYGGSKVSTF